MEERSNGNGQGIPIEPPADFPVAWPQPEYAGLHWTRDREHLPDPVTPMHRTGAGLMATGSRQRVVPVYDEALVEHHYHPFNHYLYTALVPFAGPPEELAARAQRNRQKLTAVTQRLAETWQGQWQPELADHWRFWAEFDLAGADLPALAAHLEESLARGARLYEIHFLMGPPMWFAIDEFEVFYCDLFPEATRLEAHGLLQGFDNKTLEAGRALWHLSRRARALPGVAAVLARLPAGRVRAALARFDEGRRFLAEVDTFLAAYGRRSNLWDWGRPSWEERPAPVFNNLKHYLARPDRDLEAERREAAARREAAVFRARRDLAGYPGPVVARFEQLLAAAQTALVMTEDHTYWIDFNGFGWVHRVLAEFGRRFAAQGRLGRAGDVFYLELDELREMIDRPNLDRRRLAAARGAELARWAAYAEPSELGTRPPAPIYLYSPDARRMLRYTGGYVADEAPAADPAAEAAGVLRGQAGSPGVVRGRARVVPTLAQAGRLAPGEVLVTRTTSPPWTPLFLTAAAVVTDAGGLLSHGAVVAREYGIPAVVGTGRATAWITDGEMVEVDGAAGEVRRISACTPSPRKLDDSLAGALER